MPGEDSYVLLYIIIDDIIYCYDVVSIAQVCLPLYEDFGYPSSVFTMATDKYFLY